MRKGFNLDDVTGDSIVFAGNVETEDYEFAEVKLEQKNTLFDVLEGIMDKLGGEEMCAWGVYKAADGFSACNNRFMGLFERGISRYREECACG